MPQKTGPKRMGSKRVTVKPYPNPTGSGVVVAHEVALDGSGTVLAHDIVPRIGEPERMYFPGPDGSFTVLAPEE